jgi:protein-tyrosine phosphatase
MRAEGLDISLGRACQVDAVALDTADIVATMTRAQLRKIAILSPAVFRRVFTLKELARRAQERRRHSDETFDAWATRLSAGRDTTDLLSDDPLDDIEDPVGRSAGVYLAVAREISLAISDFVDAGWPVCNNEP